MNAQEKVRFEVEREQLAEMMNELGSQHTAGLGSEEGGAAGGAGVADHHGDFEECDNEDEDEEAEEQEDEAYTSGEEGSRFVGSVDDDSSSRYGGAIAEEAPPVSARSRSRSPRNREQGAASAPRARGRPLLSPAVRETRKAQTLVTNATRKVKTQKAVYDDAVQTSQGTWSKMDAAFAKPGFGKFVVETCLSGGHTVDKKLRLDVMSECMAGVRAVFEAADRLKQSKADLKQKQEMLVKAQEVEERGAQLRQVDAVYNLVSSLEAD